MKECPICKKEIEDDTLECKYCSEKSEEIVNIESLLKKCPYCAEEIKDEAIKCKYCGETFENVQENKEVITKEDNKLKGIGGWLILVVIGLTLSPFFITLSVGELYVQLINDGTFAQFTTPNSSLYTEWFLPLSIFEIIGNFIFVIYSSILVYLLFSKYRLFPLLYQIYFVSFFIFLMLDLVLSDLVMDISVEDEGGYIVEVGRTFVSMFIWVSYMQVSKRVKNTFVEDNYKKSHPFAIIILILVFLTIVSTLSKIDTSKFSFNEYEYGNNTCIETYGNNSYYSGEQQDGYYLCECKQGYDFGGEDDSMCVPISN